MRFGKAASLLAKTSEKLLSSSPHRGFPLNRADRPAFAAIILLALIPRLLLFISLPPLLHPDSDSYFSIAQQFWSGHVADLSRRTPLYPLLLALIGRPAKAGLLAVAALQHLLGIAGALLVYLIARRIVVSQDASRDRSIATATAAAAAMLSGAAIVPALLEQSILSEPLYTFLLLAAVWLLIMWYQEKYTWAAVACGTVLGFAALTRPLGGGIFFVAVAALFPLLGARRAMRFALAAGMAFAVVLAPLLVRNYRAMGRFALTESTGRNLITVADSFVDFDRGADLPVKSIYKGFLKGKRGPDAVVVYSAMPRLRQATGWNDAEIDRALDRISREAIREHPLAFLLSRARRLPLLFRDPAASEWYALHAETYLPFAEFVGRINPDLVSRSVALRPLAGARYDLAANTAKIFSLDFTSGWMLLLPLVGMVCVVRRAPRGAAWLVAAVLAYSSIATVLLQPPNARYRIPTLGFEMLFAVAGLVAISGALGRIARRIFIRHRSSATALDSVTAPSPRRAVAAAALVVVGVVGMRAALAAGAQTVFGVSELQNSARSATAVGAGNNPPELRELSIAGRKLPVLYWKNAGGDGGAVSAQVPISGGLDYRVRSAYSCGSSDCAGAELNVEFLDLDGSVTDDAAGSNSQPLAQSRIDNDLFWDQLDRRLPAPRSVRAARVELSVKGGGGSLVIPYLTLEIPPSVFRPWRAWPWAGAAILILGAATAGGLWILLFKSPEKVHPRN